MAVVVIGTDKVIAKLKAKKDTYARGYRRGLNEVGRYVLAESQAIVPVDTGFLRDSGDWIVKGRGYNATVKVFYTAHYAMIVHERTDIPHAPGTQAKFLSVILFRKRNQIMEILRKEMRKR